MNRKKYYIRLINKYFYHLEKCQEIINYIFNNPELLEKDYMIDYPHEEFRFFSGKLGRLAKEKNKLYGMLTKQQLTELQIEKLTEREF